MTEDMEGKRSETLCTKVQERMALDILRLAAMEDVTVSEFVYRALREKLYGAIVRYEAVERQQIQGKP